jgi:hypothetical protein
MGHRRGQVLSGCLQRQLWWAGLLLSPALGWQQQQQQGRLAGAVQQEGEQWAAVVGGLRRSSGPCATAHKGQAGSQPHEVHAVVVVVVAQAA